MKLIVVDDETDIFKLYELFLKKEISDGLIELHSFDGGRTCLDYMNSNDIDEDRCVIFSDINMPEMDGYSLLEEVKKKWSDVDVYMVSAYSRDDYKVKAESLGAKMLIPKPVDFQYLKDIINGYIK
ncbi:MAG: hypothetical protein BM556_10315 [Bacteriovorax sp. MedPE-SWde]|nr:MAG: hypothetical protein BM556_10315 [Bacteriovorax sp. MedPE-SWde]